MRIRSSALRSRSRKPQLRDHAGMIGRPRPYQGRVRAPTGVAAPRVGYGRHEGTMGHRRQNDSPRSHRAKVRELGSAFAAALLSGDEIAAEVAIREAMDA